MKRILSVVLCCSIILVSICFFPEQASAAEDDSLVPVDLLDYSTFNSTGYNYGYISSDNDMTFTYSAPVKFTFWYVDVIFEVAYGTTAVTSLDSVSVVGSSGTVAGLTFSHLGDGVFRAYGSTPNRFSSSSVGIKLGSSYSRLFVTVNSFNVYTLPGTAVNDYGEMKLEPDANTTRTWQTMTSPGTPIGGNFYAFGSTNYTTYKAIYSSVNWRNFDYIDFQFYLSVTTLESITCTVETSSGVMYIPFEYSFINGSSISASEYVAGGSVSSGSYVPASSSWELTVRVYIPPEARTQGSLYLTVSGQYRDAGATSRLDKVTGYYLVHDYDPTLVKLDQIEQAIRESMSSSTEDNAAADDYNEQMAAQRDQMASDQSAIDSVSKPDSSEIGSIGAADAVLDTDGMGLLVQTLTPITHSKIVLSILTLTATLALVGYVFFGKKK